MSIKQVLTFTALCLSGLAHAEMKLDNQSPIFDQLGAFYNQGTLPTEAELTGIQTGRCYNVANKNSPRASALVGVRIPSNNGPLFPETQFRMTVVTPPYENSAPTYFDTLNQSQAEEAKDLLDLIGETSIENSAVSSSNLTGGLKFSARKYANVIVLKSTALGDGGGLKQGDTYTNCYYFAKSLIKK